MKRWHIGVSILLLLIVGVVVRQTLYSPDKVVARITNEARQHLMLRQAPTDKLRSDLEKAHTLDPSNVETMLMLGHVYTLIDEWSLAVPILEAALENVSPEDEPLVSQISMRLSRAYLRVGRYSEVFELYLPILYFEQYWVDAIVEYVSSDLATIFGIKQEELTAEARRFLTAFNLYSRNLYSVTVATLAEGKPYPFNQYLKALSYYSLKQYNEVRECLESAVKQTPDLALVFGFFPDLQNVVQYFPDSVAVERALNESILR